MSNRLAIRWYSVEINFMNETLIILLIPNAGSAESIYGNITELFQLTFLRVIPSLFLPQVKLQCSECRDGVSVDSTSVSIAAAAVP
mmetsp:Transcript_14610/g.40608  ORF Transcript_14610/g.40608 Transcript_14610/m.40608 type:complete len:86 (+) Transcript_14610:2426-2683(+)